MIITYNLTGVEREHMERGPKGWSAIVMGSLATVLLCVVAFDLTRIYASIDSQQQVKTELSKISWQIVGALAAIDGLERRLTGLEKEARDMREYRIYEKARRGER